MKLTITLELDNDAFAARSRRAEVRRILEELTVHPKAFGCSLFNADDGNLRDINGNTVGHWEVSE